VHFWGLGVHQLKLVANRESAEADWEPLAARRFGTPSRSGLPVEQALAVFAIIGRLDPLRLGSDGRGEEEDGHLPMRISQRLCAEGGQCCEPQERQNDQAANNQ
jgi:hypothetical protein